MTFSRIFGVASATFTGGIALTVLSALPACDPTLNSGGGGTSLGPCEDDKFEPNDTQAAAQDITDREEYVFLCPGDEDWWGLDFESSLGGRVMADWQPDDGGVQLEIFDDSGTPTAGGDVADFPDSGFLWLIVDDAFQGAVRATRADDGDEPMSYAISSETDWGGGE